jgi:hypothetical protein
MSPYFSNYYNNIQGIIRHFCILFLSYDNNIIINVWNDLVYHYIPIFRSNVLFISWPFNFQSRHKFIKNMNNEARKVTQLQKSYFWVVLGSLNVESW